MKLYKMIIMAMFFLTTTYSQTFYYSDFTGSAIDSLLHKVDSMLIANNYLTYKNLTTTDSTGSIGIPQGWLFSVGDPSTSKYGRIQSYMGGIAQGEINANSRGGLQFNVVRSTVASDGWMELRFNDGTRKWFWGCDASYGYMLSSKPMRFVVNAPVTTANTPQLTLSTTEGTFTMPVKATQYKLSALNTAPATSTSTGTVGEIRIDADYIYICVATNTWKRVALNETTW